MTDQLVKSICRKCAAPFEGTAKYLKAKRHICLECNREYSRTYARKYRATSGTYSKYIKQYYESNRDKYIAYRKVYKAGTKAIVDELKAVPCADCKTSYPPCVMDFDHVTADKAGNIGAMLRSASLPEILAEISKCEVVCSNCHRLRTQMRMAVKQNKKRACHSVQSAPSPDGGIQPSG